MNSNVNISGVAVRIAKNLGMPTVALGKRLGKAACNKDGFAAVEFAMIMPVMVIMLLGSVEISDALTVDVRVNTVADSIADIVARSVTVSSNDVDDIMRIGQAMIGKYPIDKMQTEVISLINSPSGDGSIEVGWSYDSRGGQPYAPGSTYPGDYSGMVQQNNSLIIAKTTYDYRSPVGQYIHGSIKLMHEAKYPSRQGVVAKTP